MKHSLNFYYVRLYYNSETNSNVLDCIDNLFKLLYHTIGYNLYVLINKTSLGRPFYSQKQSNRGTENELAAKAE